MANGTVVGLRFSAVLLKRIDALAEKLSQPHLPVTRTAVVRMLLEKGLEREERGSKK